MYHTKEEAQKKRILSNLTDKFKSMTTIAEESTILYYRARELLDSLEQEGIVEKQKYGTYTYWRKR